MIVSAVPSARTFGKARIDAPLSVVTSARRCWPSSPAPPRSRRALREKHSASPFALPSSFPVGRDSYLTPSRSTPARHPRAVHGAAAEVARYILKIQTHCQGNIRLLARCRTARDPLDSVGFLSIGTASTRVETITITTVDLRCNRALRALWAWLVKCKTGTLCRPCPPMAPRGSGEDDLFPPQTDVAGCVAGVHHQRAMPDHEVVVEGRVVGGDEHRVGGRDALGRRGAPTAGEVVSAPGRWSVGTNGSW